MSNLLSHFPEKWIQIIGEEDSGSQTINSDLVTRDQIPRSIMSTVDYLESLE
jgi:hypothetical protein